MSDSQSIKLKLDLDDCITIPAYDNTKEDNEKRKKFNRAQTKRKYQDIIDEGLDEYYNGEDYWYK